MTAIAPPRTTTLTIARTAFKTALGKLAAAVDSSAKALPVAAHVRLDVTPDWLTLTATNFDAFVRLRVPCSTVGEASMLLPAKRLTEIVASLPATGTVTLALSGARGVLTAGRSQFELRGLEAKEFPLFPVVRSDSTATVHAAQFLDAIERAVAHSSTEESRPALNTVRLDPAGDALLVVATSGHKMTRLPGGALSGTLAACSLHRTSAPLLVRLFSGLPDEATLTVTADEYRCVVEGGEAIASVRLVDLAFPLYVPVIDHIAPTRTVTCDRLGLAGAIHRVALVNEMARVSLTLAGDLTVTAEDPDRGTATDVVTLDEKDGDEPLSFNVNAAYALTALDTLTAQQVTLAVEHPRKAVLLRNADQEQSDPTVVLVQPLVN